MAFNPNNYKAPEAKKLPVILLLDVSGSMSGAKIDSLYDATIDMIETFAAAQAKEQVIDVAIITFGEGFGYDSNGNCIENGQGYD